MAVSEGSTSYELKYSDNIVKEDVVKKLHRLAITKRPFLGMCGVEIALSTWHEWLEDSIAKGSSNAQLEGATFAGGAVTSPVRVGNSCQIMWNAISIPATVQALALHGSKGKVAFEKEKGMMNLLNSLEISLVAGSAATGATDGVRRITGLQNAITSYTSAFTSFALSETIFNDRCQVVYENCDEGPTDVMVGAWLKRVISGFATNVTRNVEAESKSQFAVVDTYYGDFGIQKIRLSQYVASGSNACTAIFIKNSGQFKVAYLPGRQPHFEKFAKTADTGEEGNYAAILEGTLNYGAQGAMCMGTGFRNAA